MAVSTRIVKRRIKSIRSTGKIMKAMELVAASKMRKATQLALGTRPYAHLIHELAEKIGAQTRPEIYPFLVGHPSGKRPKKTLLVLLASDRGLCGGFNSQMVKKTLEFVRGRAGEEVSVITVGRRADQAAKRGGLQLVASFESIANAPSFERAQPIASLIVEEFKARRADRVFLAYTDFKSALSQVPIVERLLPILDKEATEDDRGRQLAEEESDTIFEPSADRIMNELLPRMIEMRIYQAFLESAASEHSARMMAMRSAGDAAKEMQETLTFTLNQARQASITREISEISAGRAALE